MKRTLIDKIERSINAYEKAMTIDLMNDAGTDVPTTFSRKADMIVNVFPR